MPLWLCECVLCITITQHVRVSAWVRESLSEWVIDSRHWVVSNTYTDWLWVTLSNCLGGSPSDDQAVRLTSLSLTETESSSDWLVTDALITETVRVTHSPSDSLTQSYWLNIQFILIDRRRPLPSDWLTSLLLLVSVTHSHSQWSESLTDWVRDWEWDWEGWQSQWTCQFMIKSIIQWFIRITSDITRSFRSWLWTYHA